MEIIELALDNKNEYTFDTIRACLENLLKNDKNFTIKQEKLLRYVINISKQKSDPKINELTKLIFKLMQDKSEAKQNDTQEAKQLVSRLKRKAYLYKALGILSYTFGVTAWFTSFSFGMYVVFAILIPSFSLFALPVMALTIFGSMAIGGFFTEFLGNSLFKMSKHTFRCTSPAETIIKQIEKGQPQAEQKTNLLKKIAQTSDSEKPAPNNTNSSPVLGAQTSSLGASSQGKMSETPDSEKTNLEQTTSPQ